MFYRNNIWSVADLNEEDIYEESALIKITERAISQLLETDCEDSLAIISLFEDAVFCLWKESNEAFLDSLHTIYDDDEVEMEWDYRTEYAHDVSDDSSWLIQHDVVKRGVCDSCHGNIQNLGHITEDLKATLHYSGMKSDSVRTACMSCGNVADVDNDSAARAHSECPSIELVLNCTIQSNNLPPKGRPQLVDCATQTEIQTSVGQMWPGLADMPRYLNPILTQLIKIGLQIPKALQW